MITSRYGLVHTDTKLFVCGVVRLTSKCGDITRYLTYFLVNNKMLLNVIKIQIKNICKLKKYIYINYCIFNTCIIRILDSLFCVNLKFQLKFLFPIQSQTFIRYKG